MSIRGLTSLIPTYGLGVDGTIKRIPDWLLDFDLQEKSGLYSLADNVAVPLGRDLVINGDFATDTDWTKGAGWTIPGGNVAHSDGSQPASVDITQSSATPYVVGKTYTYIYTISNYVSGNVRFAGPFDGAIQNGNGTFTETKIAMGTAQARLRGFTNLEADFGDFSVNQTDILASSAFADPTNNPLVGDHTGVAVGQPGQYRVQYVVTDDGASTYTDFLSAEYNSIYDPTTDFTKFSVMRKTTWDTTLRYLFHDYVDANNWVAIYTSTTQDQIVFEIRAGGITESIAWDSNGSTDLMLLDCGRDSDVFKARVNGVNVGSEAIAGTFVGNFVVMMAGAKNTTPINVHLGQRAYMDNFSEYVSDADALRIKNSMGIPG